MQHFLVPTDFSETAFAALQYAAGIASHTKTKLSILHICKQASEEAKAMFDIQNLQNSLLENPILRDIEIHLLVLSGEFMEILEELVQNTVYDYIVMGMKGSRTLTNSWLGMEKSESVDNFWVGSHTNKVLEKIKIPIIVVPQFAKFRNLQQITLAIDTKKEYISEVFEPLQTLAHFFRSNVAIVTIRLREETKEEDQEEIQLKKIKKWIGNTIVCSLKVVLADTVQEGLQYYITQKNNQDMLVMVTRKKDFFEKIFGLSATQQMVYSTDTPILILHNHQT